LISKPHKIWTSITVMLNSSFICLSTLSLEILPIFNAKQNLASSSKLMMHCQTLMKETEQSNL